MQTDEQADDQAATEGASRLADRVSEVLRHSICHVQAATDPIEMRVRVLDELTALRAVAQTMIDLADRVGLDEDLIKLALDAGARNPPHIVIGPELPDDDDEREAVLERIASQVAAENPNRTVRVVDPAGEQRDRARARRDSTMPPAPGEN